MGYQKNIWPTGLILAGGEGDGGWGKVTENNFSDKNPNSLKCIIFALISILRKRMHIRNFKT